MTVVTEGDRRVSVAANASGRVAQRSAQSNRVHVDRVQARSVAEPARIAAPTTGRSSVGERTRRPPLTREPVTRAGARPGTARVVRRAGLRPVGAMPGEVASCTVRPARRPLRALVWIGVLTAAVVVGLAVLGAFGSASSVPSATTVVQVQSGQTLSEIAATSAPGSDRAAVIARIEELNGLSSTAVDAGQPLVVPVSSPSGR